MYGLPQAGLITQELLQKRLAEFGVRPTKVGNAVMAGIGSRQNTYSPLSHLVTRNTNSK